MRILSQTIIGVVLGLCLATSDFAEEAYLAVGDLDPVALLPPPVALTSAEANAELDLVLLLQAARTPADVARIQEEDRTSLASFTTAVGPWFTVERLPRTAALIAQIQTESKVAIGPAKARFAHPRPPAVDPRVTPVVSEATASYPSGHATRGMLDALILAELVPASREALIQRGQQIGWDRVVAGVHFPSDVAAGRVLGQALARVLLAKPEFRQRLETLRQEVAAAQVPPAPPSGP